MTDLKYALPPDFSVGIGRAGFQKLFCEKIHFFQQANKAYVLDIGCGYRENRFLFPNAEYFGIDVYNPRTDKLSDDKFLIADGSRLPIMSSSFDFVFCNWVLEYIGETDAALREVFRVLKPGGKAYFGVPTNWAKLYNLFPALPLRLFGGAKNIMIKNGEEEFYNLPSLESSIHKSGLELLEICPTIGFFGMIYKLFSILFSGFRKLIFLCIAKVASLVVSNNSLVDSIQSMGGTLVPVPKTVKASSDIEVRKIVEAYNARITFAQKFNSKIKNICYELDNSKINPGIFSEVGIFVQRPSEAN